MNRLLILGILIISTAPLFAQAQQPNAVELAQKIVSIISGDAKSSISVMSSTRPNIQLRCFG